MYGSPQLGSFQLKHDKKKKQVKEAAYSLKRSNIKLPNANFHIGLSKVISLIVPLAAILFQLALSFGNNIRHE